MKLYEVTTLEPNDFNRRVKTTEPLDNIVAKLAHRYNANFKQLGQGNYAYAVADEANEPGTVKKVVHKLSASQLENDSYFAYLMFMAKNDRMSKNPYFPKIYNIKIYQGPSSGEGKNDAVYSVDMERLHPIKEAIPEELIYLGNKMFNGFEETMKEAHVNMSNSKDIARAIGEILSALAEGRNRAVPLIRIKDPYLRHALGVIKEVHAHTGNEWSDLHTGNIMLRRSPYGAQIVLTDPVA